MGTTNQVTSPKNTFTSDAERLEALNKAGDMVSGIICNLEFIDFSLDTDGDCIDSFITKDQVRGLFLIVESIFEQLKEIKQLVDKHALHEPERLEITEMIDDGLLMLDACLMAAKIRFDNEVIEKGEDYRICLFRRWFYGFFVTLNLSCKRMFFLTEHIYKICGRIPDPIESDNKGGGDGENPLH